MSTYKIPLGNLRQITKQLRSTDTEKQFQLIRTTKLRFKKAVYIFKTFRMWSHFPVGFVSEPGLLPFWSSLHTISSFYTLGWFDYLDVSFFVRRRFGHYVIRIFFPCILCTVVSWLPFWMDRSEIGDRGALGITTLLTEVFLLQYTNDAMPRVSYVKAADLFLIVSFAFTFLALLESVIVYNYKKKFFNSENGQVKKITGRRTFFRRRKIPVKEVRITKK